MTQRERAAEILRKAHAARIEDRGSAGFDASLSGRSVLPRAAFPDLAASTRRNGAG